MITMSSISPLFLIFLLIAADNWDESRVIKRTHLLFDGSLTPFYSCKFNFKVSCSWTVNGNEINISDYGYTWKTGNGSHTDDCSIQGKSNNPLDTRANRLGDEVECTGIGYGPIKVNIDDSIELQCPITGKDTCHWTRGSEYIQMNGHYKYTHDYDCSIRIDRIQLIDLAHWMCFDTTNIQWPSAKFTLVPYNTTVHTSVVRSTGATVEGEIETTTTSRKHVTVTAYGTDSTDSSYETVTADSTDIVYDTEYANLTTNSLNAATTTTNPIVLASIGIISLTTIIIGVVWFIMKRIKMKSPTHDDNNSNNRDEGYRGNADHLYYSLYNVRETATRSHTEDSHGFLISIQRLINNNTNPTRNTERYSQLSNLEHHVYETIEDDFYNEVQHPTENNPTYTIPF